MYWGSFRARALLPASGLRPARPRSYPYARQGRHRTGLDDLLHPTVYPTWIMRRSVRTIKRPAMGCCTSCRRGSAPVHWHIRLLRGDCQLKGAWRDRKQRSALITAIFRKLSAKPSAISRTEVVKIVLTMVGLTPSFCQFCIAFLSGSFSKKGCAGQIPRVVEGNAWQEIIRISGGGSMSGLG